MKVSKTQKLPITLVMCVYNEEKIIEKALKSTINYVSEIVVVHDGPCSDKTGEIVKKYGGIFIETKKNKGEAEFIRIRSYELATQKYILQLDADEYLTSDLQNILSEAVATDADFITVNWARYRHGKRIRTLVRRPFLFKKEKVYFIECPHEAVHPKAGANLKHYNLDLFNDADDRYKNQKMLDKAQLVKQTKWVPRHAVALIGYSQAVRYNTDSINHKGSMINELMASGRYWFHGYTTVPLLFVISGVLAVVKFGTNPIVLFSELPINLRYYTDLTHEIGRLRRLER
jgi:glycosyltransferase involved in cell wall biosynthesis